VTQSWRWGIFIARLDPAAGSEQAGTRPVLVVSDEDYNRIMPLVTVLPLTSRKPGRRVYPSEVLVKQGHGGLTSDSIVLAHQIRTIAKQRLVQRLGRLTSESLHAEIVDAMQGHLGIE
jgi:mRNA interferase MazF